MVQLREIVSWSHLGLEEEICLKDFYSFTQSSPGGETAPSVVHQVFNVASPSFSWLCLPFWAISSLAEAKCPERDAPPFSGCHHASDEKEKTLFFLRVQTLSPESPSWWSPIFCWPEPYLKVQSYPLACWGWDLLPLHFVGKGRIVE